MSINGDDGFDCEVFSCAGGMSNVIPASRKPFAMAVDFDPNHCASYETNLGHRPLCMDIRALTTMMRNGWRPPRPVRLLVQDPPCTPWSRSGKRLGTDDERDMLTEACELIALLKPQAYLIGNVPGLDDGPNLHIVQRLIGGLAKHGYCSADFVRLNASSYGVPQHRVRPFWFGHLEGPCIQWPQPTHGDPAELRDQLTLPGVSALLPWITCGEALAHLSGDELGRPVRLRKRDCNSDQHGSVAERPARVVGTSNLSDGNVILPNVPTLEWKDGIDGPNHKPSRSNQPAATITRNTHSDGCIILNEKHQPSTSKKPAKTVGAKDRGQSSIMTIDDAHQIAPHDHTGRNIGNYTRSRKHPPVPIDQPSTTLRGGGEGHSAPPIVITESSKHPSSNAATVTSKASRVGAGAAHALEWPRDRPATTVQADNRLAPTGHHEESYAIMSLPNAVVISEKAAAILQGFPEGWVFCGKTKKQRWSGHAAPARTRGSHLGRRAAQGRRVRRSIARARGSHRERSPQATGARETSGEVQERQTQWNLDSRDSASEISTGPS